jgi:glucose/mannose-6-phosphate isomerase
VKALDSAGGIKKYDKSGMLDIIESFPDQCQDAKRIGYAFVPPEGVKKEYSNIISVGLGGSAIGADLVRSYTADELNIPFFVVRNNKLPNFAASDTFLIASSYSGNTEEVLSAYKDARKKGCSIVVISSGGELSGLAGKDGVSIINIPAGLPPREALGYSFFPMLILLSKMGLIKDQASFIDETIAGLRKLKKNRIGYKVRSKENEAKKIAVRIRGKLPVIYSCAGHMDAVVTRWRGQLAENSKTLAFGGLFPEVSHNEIVGWENPRAVLKNSVAIMLKDSSDHSRILKRMDIFANILKKNKTDVIEVGSSSNGLLARMFSLIYTGDYVSLYLAALNKTDPYPVDRIAYLKKELSKK